MRPPEPEPTPSIKGLLQITIEELMDLEDAPGRVDRL
jgi:hypothetical protein